jgi:hypothetical protein
MEEGRGEEALDFQIFTPHPGPLPVWRGEGVKLRHYLVFDIVADKRWGLVITLSGKFCNW